MSVGQAATVYHVLFHKAHRPNRPWRKKMLAFLGGADLKVQPLDSGVLEI
jgi:hypothetical protein